jgi:hypothetical protein
MDDPLEVLGEIIAGNLRKADLKRVKSPKPIIAKSSGTSKPDNKVFRTAKEMEAEALKKLEAMP